MNEHPLIQLMRTLGQKGPIEMLEPADVGYLDKLLLDDRGLLRVVPASALSGVSESHMQFWCLKRAVYGLPTVELVDWLRDKIAGRRAIEIGAGNGALGRALGIPCTDSRMQERPEIAEHYRLHGQPTIDYPADIEKLDALEAIKAHKPEVVIASWVTQLYRGRTREEHARGGNMFGVDEDALLDTGVEYVHIGATSTHGTKWILSRPHDEFRFPWLQGRGKPEDRVIWAWPSRR